MSALPDSAVIAALRGFDTPTIANAIETLGVRLRNEGYSNATVRCLVPRAAPLVGYAVTVRVRCANPPKDGHPYVDRTDWWSLFQSQPEPRVVVVQDVDERPGSGAFMGGVHGAILQALGCEGVITNGAVRDFSALESGGLHIFASHLAVSHAYCHIVDYGQKVDVGGLTIEPGDLLHGDRHGFLRIPLEIAAQLPEAAARTVARDGDVISLCQSPDFSIAKLQDAVKGVFR
jgi:regulator of RNase E activity RraA